MPGQAPGVPETWAAGVRAQLLVPAVGLPAREVVSAMGLPAQEVVLAQEVVPALAVPARVGPQRGSLRLVRAVRPEQLKEPTLLRPGPTLSYELCQS